MTPSIQDKTESASRRTSRLGVDDPLLQELWAIKASLNAAAGYSVERLAEQALQFDMDAVMSRLRNQANH